MDEKKCLDLMGRLLYKMVDHVDNYIRFMYFKHRCDAHGDEEACVDADIWWNYLVKSRDEIESLREKVRKYCTTLYPWKP